MPLVDEHVRGVGREVREFVALHWQLLCEEARDGSKHLLLAVFLLAFGVATSALVFIAAGIALYLLLVRIVPDAAAAGLVALGYLLVVAGAWWAAWRFLKGAGALLLPRTRTLLWELITCRDEAKNSPPSSGPAGRT